MHFLHIELEKQSVCDTILLCILLVLTAQPIGFIHDETGVAHLD